MREGDVQRQIMLAAPQFGCTLLRNNVGVLQDVRGNYVTFGLAVGSSDMIGYTMIDRRAIFTAVEVKLPGKKATAAQQAFLDAVATAGGIACVAYSIEDLKAAIRAWESCR